MDQAVVFSDPTKAISTATFTTAGEYVLKLTASDGQLSASDTLTVTVVPDNQPPTVDAGPDQTIELPDPAFLKGVITDDGRPTGVTVTSTWSGEWTGTGGVWQCECAGDNSIIH